MDKEQEILAAALKLFVEFGFHGTPTSKIAKEAGVANGTLFHYFKTKEDLIVNLYNRIKTSLNDYLILTQNDEDSLQTKMKNIYTASLEWGLSHTPEFYFIQQFHFSPHLAKVSQEDIDKQTKLHTTLLHDAINAGVLKTLPIDLISSLLASHVYGVYQYLLKSNLTESQRVEIIDDSFLLIWSMITK